jgi:hypothetical protein
MFHVLVRRAAEHPRSVSVSIGIALDESDERFQFESLDRMALREPLRSVRGTAGMNSRRRLFADTVKAAKASATPPYSIVSTARANGLDPPAYLRRLFAELLAAKTVRAFETLLPFSTPAV